MNPPSLREICAKATRGADFPRNREFCVRDVLISHCGTNLTPDRIDTIGRELVHEMEHGNMSWAFKESPLVARLSPATALAVYEALEGVLRVADRKTDEFDGVRRSIALLDGRTEL